MESRTHIPGPHHRRAAAGLGQNHRSARRLQGTCDVALIPNTRIIEIHYRSADKNLAANVVNTLISTYIEQNFKTRFESTMQASDWLSKQLVDLEMKVQTSQEKLVQYQKQHEILGIDEKQNITTSKLDELNKELTAAESDRMEKESVYRLVQSGGPGHGGRRRHQRGRAGGSQPGCSCRKCASSRPTSRSRSRNSAPSSALPIPKSCS